jgi:hypothetical protein
VEHVELVETMSGLQKEVQSYRKNNERMIRSQEEQNHINTQMLQSLNILQRKIKKDYGTKQAQVIASRYHDRRNEGGLRGQR